MTVVRTAQPTMRAGSSNIQYRRAFKPPLAAKLQGHKVIVVFPAMDGFPEEKCEATFGKREMNKSLRVPNKRVGIERHRILARAVDDYCNAIHRGKASVPNERMRELGKRIFDYYVWEHNEKDLYPGQKASALNHLSDDILKEVTEFKKGSKTGFFVYDPICLHYETNEEFEKALALTDDQRALKPVHFQEFKPELRSLEALESRFGVICTWTLIMWDLSGEKICVPPQDRYSVLQGFEQALALARAQQAAEKSGMAKFLAEHGGVDDGGTATLVVRFSEIFNRWEEERDPAQSTIDNWNKAIRSLTEFRNGDDNAYTVTDTEIVEWKRHLLTTEKLALHTVSRIYFGGIKRMYSYATQNKMLFHDPIRHLKLPVKEMNIERQQPYTDEEVVAILNAAKSASKPLNKFVPWLSILSGCRVGEATMLWAEQIKKDPKVKGAYYIEIKPTSDGGRVKTPESKRLVPLHSAIVDPDGLNFMEFVRSREGKPLFYEARKNNEEGKDGIDNRQQKHHPSKVLVVRQGDWIRLLGLNLDRGKCNKGSRHWFKSKALECGVSLVLANELQGHKTKDEGSSLTYIHWKMKQLREAVEKIPVLTSESLLEE